MNWLSLLARLSLKTYRKSTKKRPIRSRRLEVELLEDRVVPATVASAEFNGKLSPNWLDVVALGADPTGNKPSDGAFQKALDTLSSTGQRVVYVPKGIYNISQTLHGRGLSSTWPGSLDSFIIEGQDPANTTLHWTGSANGTLLDMEGVFGCAVRRLTLDGAYQTQRLIWEEHLGNIGLSDASNEYSDLVFKNTQVGFDGGSGQSSELSFTRDTFQNCTSAGLFAVWNNAWNWWATECTFTNCWEGAANTVFNVDGTVRLGGAGHVNVRNSVFTNSGFSDLAFDMPATYITFADNYSNGSNRFLYVDQNQTIPNFLGQSQPSPLVLLRNTIFDTKKPDSISDKNTGPLTLIDNKIRSAAGNTGGVVKMPNGGDFSGIGNTFSVSSPFASLGGNVKQFQLDNVASATISVTKPSLPVASPVVSRHVETVTAYTGAAIQTAINAVIAGYNGQHPIVYLPAGVYSVSQTIDIPANADVQLVGDGSGTDVRFNSSDQGTVLLKLNGPTRVSLRDLTLEGAATTLLVTNADQTGSRIFGYDVTASGGTNGIVDNGTANTRLEFQNTLPGGNYTGVSVVGPGTGTGTGQFDVFNGFSNAQVLNDARVFLTNGWDEVTNRFNGMLTAASPSGKAATITLLGAFTYIGGASKEIPIVGANNFSGLATVLGTANWSDPNGHFAITGNSTGGTLFTLGNSMSDATAPFINTSTGGQLTAAQTFYTDGLYGSTQLPDVGTAAPAAIRAALAQLRTDRPSSSTLSTIGANTTDLRLFGVNVLCRNNIGTAVRILPGTLPAPTTSGLLTNGDFETGDLTGWSHYGMADVATGTDGHSGANAVMLDTVYYNASLSTTVAVKPNTRYTFTGYMKADTTGDGLHAYAYGFDAGGNEVDSPTINSFGYTQFTLTFTTDATASLVYIGFSKPTGNGGRAYVDDLSLTESSQLVANPGFETGTLNSWTVDSGTASVTGGANANSGSYAVQLSGVNVDGYQTITVQRNTTYTLSGYLKAGSTADGAYLWVWNADGNNSIAMSNTVTTPNYTSASVTFTTGPNVTSVLVGFYKEAGSGNAYVDDVTVFTAGSAYGPIVQVAQVYTQYNSTGIVVDGSTFSSSGGLDGHGNALSGDQLGGTLSVGGHSYLLGYPWSTNNVIQTAGQVLALPAANANTLSLLALAVNGNQLNQQFIVTYTDGTTQTFSQSLSDWGKSQGYTGETVATTLAYRNTSTGGLQAGSYNVYAYNFTLTKGKTVKSITLPNNTNVNILAIDLL